MSIQDIIIEKIDLEEYINDITPLTNGRGKCPIHNGINKSSLSVNGKFYHCFSCGSGGTIINFVADYEKIPYNMALERLAEKLNISVTDNEKYQKQKSIIEHNDNLVRQYKAKVEKVKDYLQKKRGLIDEIIDEFDLGYDDKAQAIVIPIRDCHGRNIAIARRYLNRQPKYVNDKNNDVYDKSATLFNLDKARRIMQNKVIAVEGYFDAISCEQQGVPAVAYCGDHITKEQISLLAKFFKVPNGMVILAADNDDAGKRSIKKTRDHFMTIAPHLTVMVMLLPNEYKDLNDALVAGVVISSLPVQHIDLYLLEEMLKTCESREVEYSVVSQFIKTVKSPMIKSDIAKFLATWWNKSVDEIRDWFKVSNAENIDDIVKEFKSVDDGIKEYKELIDRDSITIGFPTLDASLGGMRRGEVTFFGAYSSVGKTFFAVDVALHNAIRNQNNVIFFSLEMSAGALYERIIANILGISTRELEQKVKDRELTQLYDTIKDKLSKRLIVVDTSKLTIQDIDKRIKVANTMIFKDKPTDIVIIDYLQYIKHGGTFETFSQMVRDMKPLAKDNNVLVFCLSQFSREGSTWQRPNMKMLKGSGDIESTGDHILLAWRESENPKLSLEQRDAIKDIINIAIDKGRRGFIAREVEIFFNTGTTRMREKSENYFN